MGGFGSGRWGLAHTRRQADGSFRLRAPPAWMIAEGSGVWRWPKFGFFVHFDLDEHGRARLQYPTGPGLRGRTVEMEATPANLGGSRYWWRCPGCFRRCLKLYLPPRSDVFACRVCHDLSYESAQASRCAYYELFKPRVLNPNVRLKGFTASRVREHVRANLGAFTVAPYEGKPERFLDNRNTARQAGE